MQVKGLLTNGTIETSDTYLDQFDNICRRMIAPAEGVLITGNGIMHDSGFPDPEAPDADVLPPEKLPAETLVYLLGSRYCDTDLLLSKAWAKFGGINGGWSKVQAVCDYVHTVMRFSYGNAPDHRTATESLELGSGVLPGFRASRDQLLSLPQHSGALLHGLSRRHRRTGGRRPMDFSAWFEVYLDDQWRTFDARFNVPRIGRILIARGRDAVDVPIINSFGSHSLGRFDITAEEIKGSRYPANAKERRDHRSAVAEQRL